jgi:DnaJ homolog subfamily C member 8
LAKRRGRRTKKEEKFPGLIDKAGDGVTSVASASHKLRLDNHLLRLSFHYHGLVITVSRQCESSTMGGVDDVINGLEKEAKEEELRNAEIDRQSQSPHSRIHSLTSNSTGIMYACKLNAYDVFDAWPGIPDTDIKKQYRNKSLLIHPDKTDNPLASDAFDRLNKAYNELLDPVKRGPLDDAHSDARMMLLRKKGWDVDHPSIDTDEFRKQWRERTREELISNEVRKRRIIKVMIREEGKERERQEHEQMAAYLKAKDKDSWESTRDERVANWRKFQAKKTGGGYDEDKPKEKKEKKRKLVADEDPDEVFSEAANAAIDIKAGGSDFKKRKPAGETDEVANDTASGAPDVNAGTAGEAEPKQKKKKKVKKPKIKLLG